MNVANRILVLGGTLSFGAALLHVAIIFGGPNWYRFFGAGEGMAQLSEQGSSYPTIVTSCIALLLAIWGMYAFSGARIIFQLPLVKTALLLIAVVFILRGIAGVPVVLWLDDPYAMELRSKMTFMVLSSIISLGVGLCYAVGFAHTLRFVETKST